MEQLVWAAASVILFRHHPYRNSYRKVSGNEWEFPADRFNIMNGALELNAVNIVKDPEYSLHNLSHDWKDRYFDTLDNVANDVFRQVGNRIIYVAYSGGVDSIAVLAALQRHHLYKEFLEAGRFKVLLNNASVVELPSLFFNQILPNIPLVVANFDTIMNDPNAYLITGDLGDFIIGTSDVIKLTENNKTADLMSSWENLFSYLGNTADNGRYLEMYRAIKKFEPFELKSINQFAWWFSQCFIVQFELTKPYVWSSTTDLSGLDNESKVFRFFYNDKITTYSYEYMSTNPEIQCYEDSRVFPKMYSYNHFGDRAILDKPKVYSQKFINKMVQKTQILKTENGFISKFNTDRL